MNLESIQVLRDGNSQSFLLIKEGRTQVHAVAIDRQVRMKTFPKTELRWMRPLEYRGRPYPIRRAVRRFLDAGRSLGITKSARAVLNVLREQTKRSAS